MRNSFVWIDPFADFLTVEVFFQQILYFRDPGWSTDQDNVIDFAFLDPRVFQNLFHGFQSLLEQIHVKFLEFRSAQTLTEIFSLEKRIDLNSSCHLRTQGPFRVFHCFLQFPHGLHVFVCLHIILLIEHLDNMFNNPLIEILASKMCISSRGKNLKNTILDGKQTDIKRPSAQIKNNNLQMPGGGDWVEILKTVKTIKR